MRRGCQAGRPGVSCRAVKVLACVLGTVLTVLMPLAHGSPIDPSSPGFWDNGDFDDVILFLTSDLHLLGTGDPPLLRAAGPVSGTVRDRPAGTVTQRAHEPGTPRAPPAQ